MSISSSTGIGSGMDINGIVSQLITAEGKPQFDAIASQETATQTRLSGLGTLKSALSTFQTAVQKLKDGNLFKTTQAVSGNESVLKVIAGVGSVAGTHAVAVTQLAKAQQSIATTEYANSAAAVATTGGTLNFTYPVGSAKTAFAVTIDATNNTLAGVRDAINGAAGNNGVTASIINVDSTVTPGTTISKLVLTAKDTGVANGFTLAPAVAGADAGLDLLGTATPANFSTVDASDAIIVVDGQTATRSTNTITDVLQGVTLNLQSLSTSAVNVNVTLDNAAINKTITDFVTAYNSLHTATNNLGKYGGTSGATSGPLQGNSTLRNISSNLRQDASNPVTSATSGYDSLAMIGITINKDGVMALDSAKLNTALASNLSAVSDVFSSSNGVATRLDAKLTEYLQSGGPLDTQQSSLGKQLKSLGAKREAVQLRLDNLQKGLQKQFIAMDLAVGKFKSTSTYLTQRFG